MRPTWMNLQVQGIHESAKLPRACNQIKWLLRLKHRGLKATILQETFFSCRILPPSEEFLTTGAVTTLSSLPAGTFAPTSVESVLARRTSPIRELDDIDTLVRTHQARLLRFVTYATGDPDLAQSITQDTLLKAYNGRDSFRGDCTVSTWLTGIALNVIRDHLRTEKYKFWKRVRASAIDISEMASFLPAGDAGPEARILAKERVRQLAEVLQQLSDKQRTVFLLKFSEELSIEEIAELSGMGINTVRTHLHRALTAIRGRLGGTQ
jgi:RNA polymerase sigma-70 factor (ECF subfamily)